MTSLPRHLQPAPAQLNALEETVAVGGTYKTLLDTQASRLKRSRATLLISGETGTGKSLAARYLFEKAENYRTVFRVIALNEIPETLFESQLFGHRKGSFTSADRDFEGKIKSAEHGTIVLEDIATLPLNLQTKMLRVIESREFERIGDLEPTQVDIRVIATTNIPLSNLVKEGTFRRDLFYRLAVIEIQIPALRERPEDLEPLALHYLRATASAQGKNASNFDRDVLCLLRAYPWPGNVRELIGEIELAVSMADTSLETLGISEISERIRANDPALPLEVGTLSQAVRRTEREQIVQSLVRNHGHRGRAASDLQVSRRTLYNKMTELGIKF